MSCVHARALVPHRRRRFPLPQSAVSGELLWYHGCTHVIMEHRYRRHTTARIALLALSVAVLLTVGGITATVHADTGNARIQLFTQNRQLWERGDDIRALQAFLNVNNFTLALVGAGSPGHEVVLFGPRTLRALKAFQAAHALPTTGYFGPLTRAVINLSVAQKFLSQFAPAKATSALGATSSPPVTATSTLAETLPVRHLSGGSSTSPTTPSDTTAPVLSAGSPPALSPSALTIRPCHSRPTRPPPATIRRARERPLPRWPPSRRPGTLHTRHQLPAS